MKNAVISALCVILAAASALFGIVYADFAIKKDGFCGNDNFVKIEENKLEISYFGEILEIDIGALKEIFADFDIRRI